MSRFIIDLKLNEAIALFKDKRTEDHDYVPEQFCEFPYDLPSIDIPNGRLKSRYLYDFIFESDECATGELFLFDEREFAFAQKYGDKTSWELDVFDYDTYRQFHIWVTEHQIANIKRAAAVKDVSQIPAPRSNPYIGISRCSNGSNAFHIISPKCSNGYPSLFTKYKAVHNGKQVYFVKWANPKARDYTDEAHIVVVKDDAGNRYTIDGTMVAFIIEQD